MTEKLTNTFTFNYKYTHCRDCYSKLVELLWSRELFHFNWCSWQWIAMNAPISDVEDKRRSPHPLTTWKPHSMLCYFFELPVQITNWDRVLYHHITKNISSLKILETSNINHSHTPRVARNNSIASEQTMLHVARIKDFYLIYSEKDSLAAFTWINKWCLLTIQPRCLWYRNWQSNTSVLQLWSMNAILRSYEITVLNIQILGSS